MPVIVITTTRSAVAPAESVTRIVYRSARLSPAARKSKGSEPELKVQLIVPVVALPVAAIEAESMAASAASFGASPAVVPLATTEWTATATVATPSPSETVSVPLVARPAFVSARVSAALSPEPREIAGASAASVTVSV